MSRVLIEGLTKRFEGKPPTVAVDDVNLEIAEGEFLVLLGPSGCGKTTTLRCLAGLESANAGRLTFGDQRVFDSESRLNLSPDRRSIGMVFQSYALWPHMTVRKNIAYPLKARKLKRGIGEGWVERMADVVDCGELLDRYPGQLSGGQQQRVALARGLVARPDLVLFDEPLSNLDARLREQVRSELAELHGRLNFTAVYVTHDQSEALALGDRLAIMRHGRLEQLGTPRDVFASPVSEYVAGFIGMGNRLELRRGVDGWMLGDQPVVGDPKVARGQDRAVLRMRSDDIDVRTEKRIGDDEIGIEGVVVVAAFAGRHVDAVVEAGGARFDARVDAPEGGLGAGAQVWAVLKPSRAAMFDGEGDPSPHASAAAALSGG